MRDDFQFNIEFCEEVQRYASLYDYRRSDYCNRNSLEQTWEKIAQKLSANVTECKERWKNIRGSYSKYKAKLRTKSGQEAKQVKEYYLAPYLLFLDPFLKPRKRKADMLDDAVDESSIGDATEASECEDFKDNYELMLANSSLSMRSSHSSAPSPTTSVDNEPTPISIIKASEGPERPKGNGCRKTTNLPSTSMNDVNQQPYQYLQQQLLQVQNATKTIDPPDPDFAFLQSVLPDMKSMDSSQKRHFKMGILNLAEQILSSTTHQGDTKREFNAPEYIDCEPN